MDNVRMDENPYKAPEQLNLPQESRQPHQRQGGTDWLALSGLAVGSVAAVTVGMTAEFDGPGFGSPGTTDELVSVLIVGVFAIAGWCLGKCRQCLPRNP